MKITDKYVFFWGGPFSQWFPCSFQLDGAKYNCAEQAMMAQKALQFEDQDSYNKIMSTSNPKEQKALGRQVRNFNVETWNKNCREIVLKINIAKFSQNPKLKKSLLDTESKELVEASPYDTIWGIGLKEDDSRALNKNMWRGTNWLGEALVKTREYLKNN